MTNIHSIGNIPQPQTQEVAKEKRTVAYRPNFKAGEDQFVRQQPVITRPPMMDQQTMMLRAMEEQKKKQKKQELKNNIVTGVSVLSGLAMIGLVLMHFKGMKGNDVAEQKVKEFLQKAKDVKDPGIKREIEEELARQPYERNLYRVQDLFKLDKLATTVETRVKPDAVATKAKMDKEIIGMDEAKNSIVKYLESIAYDIENGIQGDKPIIICLDGPPGTGKTSLAKAIAESLGMYFKKVSYGGAKNAEMLTGFERTYAGATPGLIAKGQLEGNTKKVLYCIDEVDRVSGNGPLDALLPLFDDQRIFTDKYYNSNIDISQSIFTLTTNNVDRLPEALRNRLQIIKIGEYTPEVKSQIAKMKLEKDLATYKMTDKVTIKDDTVYETLAKLTEDQGGRETTRNVTNLVEALKSRFVNGDKKIELDSKLVEQLLTTKP